MSCPCPAPLTGSRYAPRFGLQFPIMHKAPERDKDELRKRLSPRQYHVTQEKGTEAPFSGELLFNKETGAYECVCCGAELFHSSAKFDSGAGWPSFFQPASENAVTQHADHSGGMQRIEVVCSQCNAHLGHLFPDGPRPTGMRYCINSASLRFARA